MARTRQDVTDAELAVVQVLWDRGPASVRQLSDVLYPEGTASQHATVLKLLERLEAKGCVARDRGPWPHLFRAVIDRDEVIGRRLRAIAGRLCGGSLAPLLAHLLRSKRLSPTERRRLCALRAAQR
jgi:BlaI family transcriptional regulator, penicillinase repressor